MWCVCGSSPLGIDDYTRAPIERKAGPCGFHTDEQPLQTRVPGSEAVETSPARPGAGLDRSEHARGDLGQGLEEGFDLGLGRERPGAEPEGAVGEGPQGAVDVRGAVQAGADGRLEAGV